MSICRLCLLKNSIISVFDQVADEDRTYADSILFCLELKVPENSKVKTICKACSEILESFYRFKVLALKNEMWLDEYTLKPSLDDEVKIEIDNIKVKNENEQLEFYDDGQDLGDIQYENGEEYEDNIQQLEYLKDQINNEEGLTDTSYTDTKTGRKCKVKAAAAIRATVSEKLKTKKFNSGYDDEDPPYEPPIHVLTNLSSSGKTGTVCAGAVLQSELPVKYKCPKCNTYVENIRDHLETSHDYEKSNSFGCLYCTKAFRTKIGFNRHIETQHKDCQVAAAKDTFCDICNKDFKKLESHRARSHGIGDELFKCNVCSTKFITEQLLRKHIKKHKEKKKRSNKTQNSENRKSENKTKKTFVCQFCPKVFDRRYHLERHELVHSGVKPFRCDQCDKSFTYDRSLKMHLLIHSGNKQIHCAVCDKAFYTKGAVERHMIKHTSAQPFSCDYCRMKFKRKFNKHDHERRAHPEEVNLRKNKTPRGRMETTEEEEV